MLNSWQGILSIQLHWLLKFAASVKCVSGHQALDVHFPCISLFNINGNSLLSMDVHVTNTFNIMIHPVYFPLKGAVIYFCLLALSGSRSQDNFYFDPAPIDQDVLEGEDTLLRCDVSNRKHIAFYWQLDGKPLVNTSRRYQDESDLRIKQVDRNKDSGSFRCIATNISTGVSLISTEAKLNIICKILVYECHTKIDPFKVKKIGKFLVFQIV